MPKKYLRHATTLCLFTGMYLLSGVAAIGADSERSIDDKELLSSIRSLVDKARHLRPLLDRSQFELEPLLDSKDYESEELIRFVTDEIRIEIYAGALRGARGTLVSQAGNALDQSLLLATLLKDSGFEARINRGRLDEKGEDVHSLSQPRHCCFWRSLLWGGGFVQRFA